MHELSIPADLVQRVIARAGRAHPFDENWSVYHDWLQTPERRDRRYSSMDTAHEGHALWAELDAKPENAQIVKKRFSAFLPG